MRGSDWVRVRVRVKVRVRYRGRAKVQGPPCLALAESTTIIARRRDRWKLARMK